jgi:hypothetical protein
MAGIKPAMTVVGFARISRLVMAGLDPAIHVFLVQGANIILD